MRATRWGSNAGKGEHAPARGVGGAPEAVAAVRMLGVDALPRVLGKRYGIVLVDLRQVVCLHRCRR
jgi:hypothetical protein